MKTLRDVLPFEALEFTDSKFIQFLDIKVLEEVDGCVVPWVGTHKNVMNWWKLENGYAVGWNESPVHGWSFPCKNTTHKKIKRSKKRKHKTLDLIGAGVEEDFKYGCKSHFRQRYHERFGVVCKFFVYDILLDLVKNSKPYKPSKVSNRFHHIIEYDGVKLNVVYDKKLDVLVTLLDPIK